jgi:hypothetical protein
MPTVDLTDYEIRALLDADEHLHYIGDGILDGTTRDKLRAALTPPKPDYPDGTIAWVRPVRETSSRYLVAMLRGQWCDSDGDDGPFPWANDEHATVEVVPVLKPDHIQIPRAAVDFRVAAQWRSSAPPSLPDDLYRAMNAGSWTALFHAIADALEEADHAKH